ncbi:MAG TPA: NUDIX hydrolase [Clostridiales bacterium]|nr:MAG: NTP pyrophosphohydrolase [Clostridiales bacterium GWD2_32_19]HCC08071.1 NUDIX hydrolase [Clostridiales bacterium]
MYPNYRVSVSIIIEHKGKVLLAKRSENTEIRPGKWEVPAGKVKYSEIPVEALIREAKEETNLDVELIKEVEVRAVKLESEIEEVYRLIYTYLVRPKDGDISSLKMSNEHTEYAWVDKESLADHKYDSLHENVRRTVEYILN